MINRLISAQDATDLEFRARTSSCCDLRATSSSSNTVPGKIQRWEVGRHFTLMPGRLSFAIYSDTEAMRVASKAQPHLLFFSSREQANYLGYCADFGPCDLSTVVSFCIRTRNLMADKTCQNRMLVHSSTLDEAANTNAAFLLGAYLVLIEVWTPEEAAAPFERIQPSPFKAFRDATYLPSDFDLSILDCLSGLARAYSRRWFSVNLPTPKNQNPEPQTPSYTSDRPHPETLNAEP